MTTGRFIVVNQHGAVVTDENGSLSELRTDGLRLQTLADADELVELLKFRDRQDAALMGRDIPEHEFPLYFPDEYQPASWDDADRVSFAPSDNYRITKHGVFPR